MSTISNWFRYGALAVVALAAVAGLVWLIGDSLHRHVRFSQRITTYVAAVAEVAVLVVVLRTTFTSPLTWQVLVALLPLLLIGYHVLNLWREKPVLGEQEDTKETAIAWQAIQRALERHFAADAILGRYLVPALFIPIVGLMEFGFISDPRSDPFGLGVGQASEAFACGLLGAYFFVFLELGKRAVRSDITPVSILWCLTTLVIGPALAALLPAVLAQPASESSDWTKRALWVFAGYSPRLVFGALAKGAQNLLHVGPSAVRDERRIPLVGQVSGIGEEEEQRLAEEGIRDAHGLACADVVRLMRDTRFDNWSILTWVDEALLITWVPKKLREELQNRGYPGATDLTGLVPAPTLSQGSPPPVLSSEEAKELRTTIAGAAGLNEVQLRDMIARLVADPRTKACSVLARALARQSREEGVQHAQPLAGTEPKPAPAPSSR